MAAEASWLLCTVERAERSTVYINSDPLPSDSHGDFEAVRILAEAGFDSIDYTFLTLRSEEKLWWLEEDWRHYAIKLRQTA